VDVRHSTISEPASKGDKDMNSSKTRKITIPADIMAEINELPESGMSGRNIKWTPEQDAILIHLMETKCRSAIYKWWRSKYGWGSRDSLSRRYDELVAMR